MAPQYRIINEGHNAFYVEVSRPFLFFTLWSRLRDCHGASKQGYSYSPGACVRYRTAEDAAEAIEYLQAAAMGYVLAPRELAYN